LYVILYALGLSIWPATLIAWAFGFLFRLAALHFKWEEPEPWTNAPTPLMEVQAPNAAASASK
jgi:uncharacterized membrane protein YeiH